MWHRHQLDGQLAMLGRLTAEHRELSIQLVPVPRSFSLSRREADIAITVERPAEGRLVAAKLVDYSLGLYASRAYAERNGLPANRAELSRHSLVGYVGDLVASPSLDYAAEFSPDWAARFAISWRWVRSRRSAPARASEYCILSSRAARPTWCR